MILASIKPYYYYLIAEEKKKIEVRKTALKNLPQDIAFYMSKDEKSFAKIPKEFQAKYREHFGKVGMKVVCDNVEKFYCASVPYKKENNLGYGQFVDNGVYKVNGWHEGVVFERNDRYIDTMLNNNDLKEMCLSAQELFDYIGIGKHLYGWHISDLKIYDKPKELSEFHKPCENKYYCEVCKHGSIIIPPDEEEYALYHGGFYEHYETVCHNIVNRPPQSWQYVEELEK